MNLPLPLIKNVSTKSNLTSTLSAIKNQNGNKLITSDQANQLTNLKFSNGEYRLTLEDRSFVYEVIWLLKELGFEKTFNFLSADWEKVLGEHNIRKKMFFENPLLDKTREKFIQDMDIFKNTVQVEAGEKCRKCGSEETISVIGQTKRCDEAQTIRIYCTQCGNRWTAQ